MKKMIATPSSFIARLAPKRPPLPLPQLLWQWVVVALAYYVGGRLGLAAPSFGNSITLIWVPTGIAVAALLQWGARMWPAIGLSAFCVNLAIGLSPSMAVLIAIGNTLGPLWSMWLLNAAGFDRNFSHRKDIVLLIAAAASGMLVSASGGVTTLWLNDALGGNDVWLAWRTWWLGDTVGVLIAMPPLITVSRKTLPEITQKPVEALFFTAFMILLNWFIFLSPFGRYTISFAPVPIVIWAAMRFGITGASTTVLISSILAAWGTATGHGPFSLSARGEALLILWAYITTLVIVSLVITALLAESRRTAAQLKLHSQILHNMHEGVQLTRVDDSVIVYSNPTFDAMFGYAPGELIGAHVSTLNAGRETEQRKKTAEINRALFSSGAWCGEIQNAKKDGTPFWCLANISTFDHPTLGPVWVSVHTDITQRKEAEEKIHFLAFYDPLTQLPNRRLLLERLRHMAASGKRNQHHAALLFIDLDHFKTLNDSKGHNTGDLLLIEVANRLKACVREGDTVARLGGDEFVVVLPALSQQIEQAARHVSAVAEKIRAAMVRPYLLEDYEYHCSSSIGIDLFREREVDVTEVFKRADVAMYRAKAQGRNAACFYDATLQPPDDDTAA